MQADPLFLHSFGQAAFYRLAIPLHRESLPDPGVAQDHQEGHTCPRRDSAAARNQASNSLFARTTAIGRSPRVATARFSKLGPSSAGQPFSQSQSTIMTIPPLPWSFRAASSTDRSISPSFSSREAGTRRGGRTFGTNPGSIVCAILRMRMGTASHSPCPSTMAAILTSVMAYSPRKAQAGMEESLPLPLHPALSDSVSATRPPCKGGPLSQIVPLRQVGQSSFHRSCSLRPECFHPECLCRPAGPGCDWSPRSG